MAKTTSMQTVSRPHLSQVFIRSEERNQLIHTNFYEEEFFDIPIHAWYIYLYEKCANCSVFLMLRPLLFVKK